MLAATIMNVAQLFKQIDNSGKLTKYNPKKKQDIFSEDTMQYFSDVFL